MEKVKLKDYYVLGDRGQKTNVSVYDIVTRDYTSVPENAEMEFVQKQTRWVGTGYKNSIYRLMGTDDAIIIVHGAGKSYQDALKDCVEYEKGYFTKQKEYARECGKVSREHDIPFYAVLALGPEMAIRAKIILKNTSVFKVGYFWDELGCGISRRKAALLEIFKDDTALCREIEYMGQINSGRLAEYVSEFHELENQKL